MRWRGSSRPAPTPWRAPSALRSVQKPAYLRQEFLPPHRKNDPLAHPLEEQHAQLVFEILICRLTALCVRLSSAAAWVKLPWRAAHSKACSVVTSGTSRRLNFIPARINIVRSSAIQAHSLPRLIRITNDLVLHHSASEPSEREIVSYPPTISARLFRCDVADVPRRSTAYGTLMELVAKGQRRNALADATSRRGWRRRIRSNAFRGASRRDPSRHAAELSMMRRVFA